MRRRRRGVRRGGGGRRRVMIELVAERCVCVGMIEPWVCKTGLGSWQSGGERKKRVFSCVLILIGLELV